MNYKATAEAITRGQDITVASEDDRAKVYEELYLIEKEKRKNFYPLGKVRVMK